jgi:NADPH:quinone reductase-like Zn-dependent oxidoreductase
MGAETYGTASPAKHDFLTEKGLDYPIDYRNRDYERVLQELTGGQGVHLILDPLGGPHWRKNYRLLHPTGRVVYFGASSIAGGKTRSVLNILRTLLGLPFFNPIQLMNANKGVLGVNLGHLWEYVEMQREWMSQIFEWYDEALFRPHVDRTFPFSRVAEAHHYIQDRKNLGKVLLVP